MTGNYSTREYREKLYDDLHVRLSNILILMCSIFIASIGLNMNSTAVVIEDYPLNIHQSIPWNYIINCTVLP